LWSDLRETLFGTSGVRGVANVDLTPEFVLKLGLTIANLTSSGRVAVGFDTRTSSQMMVSSLIGGLLAGGAAVRNYGLVPTPYWRI
jgi:phosphomannomutase